MQTTPRREHVLNLIRKERERQIENYGSNDDILPGFGSNLSNHPWLLPYSDASSNAVEAGFRADYEAYEVTHGKPTWMHLIREEVAELFDTRSPYDTLAEAVQVAALCTSLCEHLLAQDGITER